MKIKNYINTVKCKILVRNLLTTYNALALPHLNIKKPAKWNESNVRGICSFIAKSVDLEDTIKYLQENTYKNNKVESLLSLTGGYSVDGIKTYHGVNLSKLMPTDNYEGIFDSYEADEELEAFLKTHFDERGIAYPINASTPAFSKPTTESNPMDSFVEEDEDDNNDFVVPNSDVPQTQETTPEAADSNNSENSETQTSNTNSNVKPTIPLNMDKIKEFLQKTAEKELEGYQLVLQQNAMDMLNQALENKKNEVIDEVTKVMLQNQLPDTVIKIKEVEHRVPGELYHEKFEDVLQLVANKINIYLYSEAGIGKSHLAKQIAKALNLPIYFLLPGNSIDLLGYEDAMGKFHETAFTQWVKNGGILYASEFDANDASLILNLNTALANGYTNINGKTVTLHKDCRFIADGNSKLTGATSNYAGRQRQDASIIDRLMFVEMKNDYKLELALSNNNKEWISFIKAFREQKNEQGANITVSLRATEIVLKVEQCLGTRKALEGGLLKGANMQVVKAIAEKLAIKLPQNKYAKALLEVK